MRRIIYVLVGVGTVNLALMVAMYVYLLEDEKCDIGTRGLAVWSDEGGGWETISLPEGRSSDLPPCTGKLRTELEVLPG